MRRRTFLGLGGMIGVLVLAADSTGAEVPGAPAPPAPDGRVFYVASDGNDGDTGRDTGSGWASVSRVNAALAAGEVAAGDSVLFETGGVYFGKIRPRPGADRPITFAAYTRDPATAPLRPVISSYKLLNTESGWTRHDENTWVVDLSEKRFGTTHSGYDGAEGGNDNIGFLRVDGVIFGRRRSERDQLAQRWDFHCAGPLLYVRADRHPVTLASDIRAACDTPCLQLADHVTVQGLRLEGSGGHGIQGIGAHIRVRDNHLAELGGAYLDEQTRYGNGVEVWIGSEDVIVEGNRVHDVYDAGLTIQGSADSVTDGWRDIAFRGNLLYRCNQSLEFWSAAGGHAAPGFINCVAEGNVCLFAGRGWSADVRPDRDVGVHVLTYEWGLPADITVRQNVFYDARSAYRFSSSDTTGLTLAQNVVLLRPGVFLEPDDRFGLAQYRAWTTARENDRDSTFLELPSEASDQVGDALAHVRTLRPPAVTEFCLTDAVNGPCQ